MKKILIFALMAIVLGSCDTGNRVENTKELSNEINASKIKRVTNTQLIYSADAWGKKISKIAEKSLSNELSRHPEKAGELCQNLAGIPVIAALQKEYGVKVELLDLTDLKNPDLAPKERELLDAYLYSAKSKSVASDNLQQLSDTSLVYNAPVPAESLICKSCLPKDEIPFAVWRLLFNKKDIIRKLDAKQLKD
ncbi:hypothetical protein MUK70_22060 [Dyadobacter chenwenxiniae]|uniref:Lipoprotein n=1 Tax=Dyadobacter chenwenxiniae TaxID=2906456 RepID=A0A9X1TES4_9BACT|nr:hypothetical protein [Dyadobacter chenwenxiniae]MCF0049453.1 hypothetical protein [Dyadobacter chenwenxiniae]MCF0061929.1 hypothetical protein [Dyadobacter chenwenxiniae]UON81743.1 hypothetical protein MUK70_22060 [Dyadobacter chenwenxiniae]